MDKMELLDHLHRLRQAEENGLVTERQEGHLSLFKYTQDCAFKKRWSKTAKKARGIILDNRTGAIVCRPFDKFFNIDEMPGTKRKAILHRMKMRKFKVYDKLDGSMIALWYYDGRWHTSTTGAINSKHSEHAMGLLESKYPQYQELSPNQTYLFEMIGVDWDRKVVHYKEEKLVLLAMMWNEWDLRECSDEVLDAVASHCGFGRPVMFDFDPDEVLSGDHIDDDAEGYVIQLADGTRTKLKSLRYVRLHRFMGFIRPKRIIEFMRSHTDYDDLLDSLPVHMLEQFDDLFAAINGIKSEVLDEVEAVWRLVEDPENYKACALLFAENASEEVRSILFARMRGKPIEEVVWKAVEKRTIEEIIQ